MSFYILIGVFVFIDLPKYALTSVSYSESIVYAMPDIKKIKTYQQQIVEKSEGTDPRQYHRPGMGPKDEKHLNIMQESGNHRWNHPLVQKIYPNLLYVST